MPATEQTWRDIKLLHVVFGIASILMFVATLWLLAADHNREWKGYQRKFHDIESWTLAARNKEQATASFEQRNQQLLDAIYAAQVAVPPRELIDRFIAQMEADPLTDGSAAKQRIINAYDALVETVQANAAEGEGQDDLAAMAKAVVPARDELLDEMHDVVASGKFYEDYMAGLRKFRLADYDEMKSKYDLGVRDQVGREQLDKIQQRLDQIQQGNDTDDNSSVQGLTEEYEKAKQQRLALEGVVAEITHDSDAARKLLDDHEATRKQLAKSLQEKTGFWQRVGHNLLQLPIIDGFGRPLKVNQIWLPDLTLNNNFIDVARFDRCMTCHVAIDKTAPGSPIDPGYPVLQEPRETTLATPAEAPESADELDTKTLYGMQLSEKGLIHPDDVVVEFVWPNSAAARAGLEQGDVITNVRVADQWEEIGRASAQRYLVDEASWGEPITLRYRRGMPQPFSSHPRLDLFVGSTSPHKLQTMGCTICHEGQGSATQFKWASHSPNTPKQAAEWTEEFGWFDNHHWIFPMRPQRFMESSCLKCHYSVEELEPSERFPDPPAPTLVHGYKLVRKYGCYGCHEINGYDGNRRIGPDLRNEPSYAPAAQQVAYVIERTLKNSGDGQPEQFRQKLEEAHGLADSVAWHPDDDDKRRALYDLVKTDADRTRATKRILADPGLPGEPRKLAQEIGRNPLDTDARQALVDWLESDRQAATPQANRSTHTLAHLVAEPPVLDAAAHRMADVLKDVENPGRLRRVGPSLRYVASKLGEGALNEWITNPQNIRPTSKMPHFFGQHYHLNTDPAALKTAEEFEPVEIRAAASYLLARSQPFQYAPQSPEVTEEPDAARGKTQFETRGCLACHQHADPPQGNANHGPNLTDLARKLRTEHSMEWLRSWLLEPDRYHRRTVMPNTYLEPVPLIGDDGQPVPRDEGDGKYRITDPAADIAAYLLGPDWEPVEDQLPALTENDREILDQLARSFLGSVFPRHRVDEFLADGIPQRLAGSLKGAEVELVGEMSEEKLLAYVGRRTISRYGCSGCHDVPGFEDAKPIGTTLADWGRKETARLAFEHIVPYLEHKFARHEDAEHGETEDDETASGEAEDAGPHEAGAGHTEHGLNPEAMEDETEGYFVQSLLHHQREGFLRQKLLEPRSYDYEKAGNKPYQDRLRMPQFPWAAEAVNQAKLAGKSAKEIQHLSKQATDDNIQAVMTFVLGLVAEPPVTEYVYHPDTRREAIIDGHAVLDKFNCAGCHVLELDRWKIAYEPSDFEASAPTAVYPFLEPRFTPEQVEQSKTPDRRGKLHGELVGMLRTDGDGDPEVMAWIEEDEEFLTLKEYRDEFDEEPSQLGYNVEIWQPTLLDGNRFLVKDPMPTIPGSMITAHYQGKGGDFARLMLPIAVQLVRRTEPGATGTDAWAWVPPPLIRQGHKTQQKWLTEFLLQPHPIRPGVLLRMPKFNMSRADATRLVQYFAAASNPSFPNQFQTQTSEQDLQQANIDYQEHLQKLGLPPSTRYEDALKIVINKAGCITCHGVADQTPEGGDRANGPNLANVYARLQPSYMKRWIAKPSFTLPYTKMQELIPYDPNSPTLGGFSLPVLDADGKPVLDEEGNPKTMQVYHGTSVQQLQAVVDLLASFDRFLKARTSIRALVEQQKAENPSPRDDTR